MAADCAVCGDAAAGVCSTMTLNDHTPNPPKITDGEEAYELCAAAYKGGVNTFEIIGRGSVAFGFS
jgi:hypothetical protein